MRIGEGPSFFEITVKRLLLVSLGVTHSRATTNSNSSEGKKEGIGEAPPRTTSALTRVSKPSATSLGLNAIPCRKLSLSLSPLYVGRFLRAVFYAHPHRFARHYRRIMRRIDYANPRSNETVGEQRRSSVPTSRTQMFERERD